MSIEGIDDVGALLAFVRYSKSGDARIASFVEHDGTEHYAVLTVLRATFSKAEADQSLSTYRETMLLVDNLLRIPRKREPDPETLT